ncbi:hypothetical protein KKI90_15385 [Xenorhabdus bovienii]
MNNQSFFFQRDGVWTWTVQQGGAWKGEINHPGRGGTMALLGDSYTKGESDGKYQPRGNYQHAGNYQPAGNYAVRGESYTRGESDGRYQVKGASKQWIRAWGVGAAANGSKLPLNIDARGVTLYIKTDAQNNFFTCTMPPVDDINVMFSGNIDGLRVVCSLGNSGRSLYVVDSFWKITEIWASV